MDAEAKTISTYCPYCDREVVAPLSTSVRMLLVKGQPTEFESTDAVCSECGQVVGDSRVEDGNLRRAYDAYRRNNGLLPVEEVRSLRDRYGLSLREFARFLGFGDQTVARYEAGAIQDPAHDVVMRLASTPDGAAALLRINGGRISEASKRAVERFMAGSEADAFDRAMLRILGSEDEPSAENGFRKLDMARVRSLIVTFANRCRDLYTTKLQKAMYFCDALCFERTAKSMTGLTYAHAPRGPIIDQWNLMVGSMERGGFISLDQVPSGWGEIVVAHSSPEVEFDEGEREIIDTVVAFVNTFDTARAISECSHQLSAWIRTTDGQKMDYLDSDGEVSKVIDSRLEKSEFVPAL